MVLRENKTSYRLVSRWGAVVAEWSRSLLPGSNPALGTLFQLKLKEKINFRKLISRVEFAKFSSSSADSQDFEEHSGCRRRSKSEGRDTLTPSLSRDG